MAGTWPATLPDPSFDHVQDYVCGILDPEDNLWPQQTRRQPDPEGTVNLILDQEQMEIFRAFFNSTLNGGADWLTASWVTLMHAGAVYARFIDGYNAAMVGNHWQVSARLEYLTV